MPGPGPNVEHSPAVANRRRRLILGAIAAAVLLVTGCGRPSAGEQTHQSNGNERSFKATDTPDRGAQPPLALVYSGPQGCPACAPTAAELLSRAPQPYRVKFVGPGTDTPLTAEVLSQAQLYVQPGGGADLDATWQDLKGSTDVIRHWVKAGGSYVGLCFGAYLAGRNPGFDLLPGDTHGYIDSTGATVPDGRDVVIPVTWQGKPRHMYFQDGPVFLLDNGANATVMATYDNGLPAVVVAPYGKGRVGVSGPHPEADETWYEEKGLTNPDGVRFDLAYELIEATTARR